MAIAEHEVNLSGGKLYRESYEKRSNCSCGHLCSFIKDLYQSSVQGGRLAMLQLYRLQTQVKCSPRNVVWLNNYGDPATRFVDR